MAVTLIHFITSSRKLMKSQQRRRSCDLSYLNEPDDDFIFKLEPFNDLEL